MSISPRDGTYSYNVQIALHFPNGMSCQSVRQSNSYLHAAAAFHVRGASWVVELFNASNIRISRFFVRAFVILCWYRSESVALGGISQMLEKIETTDDG